MSNEEKILELLAAMDARQTRTEELLAAMDARISTMDARISTMDARMSTMETKLDDLTEAHEETREGVNTLLSWAEKASNALSLPLPKIGQPAPPPLSQTRVGFFCSCPTTPRPPTVRCIRPPDATGWQTARQNRSTPG